MTLMEHTLNFSMFCVLDVVSRGAPSARAGERDAQRHEKLGQRKKTCDAGGDTRHYLCKTQCLVKD